VTRYTLDPAMPVLMRPDDTVQVGWDPRRAVLVNPPAGLTPDALADLLRALQSGLTLPVFASLMLNRGAHDAGAAAELVDSLTRSKVLTVDVPRTRSASVRVHGRGPLSDLLTGALRCSGNRIAISRLSHAGVNPRNTDLVVLSDYLVTDPQVVHDLHDAGVPHLQVRVRDGTGLVGPLVVPGQTSCLRCADLHRSDRDAAWPAVAAQLRRTVGNADRATVLATAALALDQVERVVKAVQGCGGPGLRDAPPPTLDTTLEFDVHTGSTVSRRWSRHPQCGC
jgi:bacteriocin biosynthesis cyclodehydratase domain-containing protein